MSDFSKSQIDRLGDRLRQGPATEDDLRLLEEYKQSFGPSYAEVLEVLRRHAVSVKGRPEKSTLSIVAKLRREAATRLSRMQDIAGCRIVVDDVVAQDQLIRVLLQEFPAALVKDRRKISSHGYRAVHLIVLHRSMRVEIQVRTLLQHIWAEVSEKASDAIDPNIKYGNADPRFSPILEVLRTAGEAIARHESEEEAFAGRRDVELGKFNLDAALAQHLEILAERRAKILDGLSLLSSLFESLKRTQP